MHSNVSQKQCFSMSWVTATHCNASGLTHSATEMRWAALVYVLLFLFTISLLFMSRNKCQTFTFHCRFDVHCGEKRTFHSDGSVEEESDKIPIKSIRKTVETQSRRIFSSHVSQIQSKKPRIRIKSKITTEKCLHQTWREYENFSQFDRLRSRQLDSFANKPQIAVRWPLVARFLRRFIRFSPDIWMLLLQRMLHCVHLTVNVAFACTQRNLHAAIFVKPGSNASLHQFALFLNTISPYVSTMLRNEVIHSVYDHNKCVLYGT